MADGASFPFNITFTGGSEASAALRQLGEAGAEAFTKITQAAAHGDFTGLITMIGGELPGAFAEAGAAIEEFVQRQAEAAENMSNLATASGMSIQAIQGLEAAFASVGVSTSGFERTLGRLAITIGRDWSQIAQSVRSAAYQSEQAQEGMRASALATQEAYNRLRDTMEQVSESAMNDEDRLKSAKTAVEEARLQQQRDQVTQQQHEEEDIAQRQHEEDMQKLNAARRANDSTSASRIERQIQARSDHAKVNEDNIKAEQEILQEQSDQLKNTEDQNAAERAKHQLIEANIEKARQEREATLKIQQAEENVKRALTAQKAAAEHAYEVQLKDLPHLARELNNIAKGYSRLKDNMDLVDASAQNIARALMLSVSGTGDVSPNSMIMKMAALFHQLGTSAQATNIEMAVLQNTMASMGGGGGGMGANPAQLRSILMLGPKVMEDFQKEMQKFGKSGIGFTDKDVTNLEAFNGAWSELDAITEQVSGHFAAILAVPMAKYFREIRDSIESDTGTLHSFIAGIDKVASGMMTAISAIGHGLVLLKEGIDDVFGKGASTKIIEVAGAIIGIGAASLGAGLLVKGLQVALSVGFAPIIGAIRAVIETFKVLRSAILVVSEVAWGDPLIAAAVLVGVAIAELVTHWQQVKQAAIDFADYIASSWIGKVVSAIGKAIAWIALLAEAWSHVNSSGSASAPSNTNAQTMAAGNSYQLQVVGRAAGGLIRGPGGPTEDRAGLFALSDGEYVMRTAAVRHYGAEFFEALNALAVGGFAAGGLVGSRVRVAAPPSVPKGPSSILNLTIDGNHFNGLLAPEDTAARLKSYAVSRQSASTGPKPSWMR